MPRLKTTTSTVKRRVDSSRKQYVIPRYKWTDPFPEIHGTLPEKMVYAQLTKFGIPFLFLNDLQFNDPDAEFYKTYQVDFVIPNVKLIIEVQGVRWHSSPSAIEADSYKLAVYESFGYKALAWWDYDIFDHLIDLIVNEPLLRSQINTDPRNKPTELTPIARTKVDTSKGIRTVNQRRRKPYRQRNQLSRKQIRKVQSSYAPR